MSETVVAFARRYLCRSETVVAFAGAGRASTETAIAFAGAKWAFLVRFSAAVVLPVSMVAVWGRALVMVVSCWPEPVAAEVSLVSKSPWAGVLSAKKFALLDRMCVRARKSLPCSLTTPQIRRFCAFRAKFFAETWLEARCWASIFTGRQSWAWLLGPSTGSVNPSMRS